MAPSFLPPREQSCPAVPPRVHASAAHRIAYRGGKFSVLLGQTAALSSVSISLPCLGWKLCLCNLLLTVLRLPCCGDGLHELTLKLLLLLPSPSADGAEQTVNIFCTTDQRKPLSMEFYFPDPEV